MTPLEEEAARRRQADREIREDLSRLRQRVDELENELTEKLKG